jgi:hypothetical protein
VPEQLSTNAVSAERPLNNVWGAPNGLEITGFSITTGFLDIEIFGMSL